MKNLIKMCGWVKLALYSSSIMCNKLAFETTAFSLLFSIKG